MQILLLHQRKESPGSVTDKKLVCELFFSFINRMIIGHPCMVLRRQCQVHQMAKKIHLTPFTLVPSVINIITKDVSCQGVCWLIIFSLLGLFKFRKLRKIFA